MMIQLDGEAALNPTNKVNILTAETIARILNARYKLPRNKQYLYLI